MLFNDKENFFSVFFISKYKFARDFLSCSFTFNTQLRENVFPYCDASFRVFFSDRESAIQ